MLPIHAGFLKGEIEYSSFNIQDYLSDKDFKENQNCLIGNTEEYNNRRVVRFSDGTYGIKYFEFPLYSFYYTKNGILTSYTRREKPGFPSEVKKFKANGKLIYTGYQISENESYWFSQSGKMIAHWINQNCYNSEGNIIMKREK